MASPAIKIGESEYTLRPFKAYKALIAGELISRVGDEIRELLSDLREYEARYRAQNVTRFTRAQALARGWEFPADAFVTPEGGGEAYIDLPAIPSPDERTMFIFPRAFKLAKEEVTKLLALIVIPDAELRVTGDEQEAALAKLGERLLAEGDVGEIVELLAATIEHVQAQLSPHEGAVGKIRGFLRQATRSRAEPEEPEDRKTTLDPAVVIEGSPELSTPSPAPTDGSATTSSSMAPAGANSST